MAKKINDITGEIVDCAYKIHPVHQSQILTYLKLSKLDIGLLINFNVPLIKDGIKRFHV